MPFTPAHPAIVLPFLKINKRYLSATGLIAGSITPDFEYFINMSVKGPHSHTIAGLFYFDIPLGISLAILFHQVAKWNLIDNLPAFFQRRFSPLREIDFFQYIRQYPWALILAVALGAWSHLLWDSFTHRNGFFVQLLPFYKSVFPFQGVRYPMFYAMQHISTFVGLFIVVMYIVLMKPDHKPPVFAPRIAYWIAVLAIASVILLARFTLGKASLNLGNFVVSMITAVCVSLLVTGRIQFNPAPR